MTHKGSETDSNFEVASKFGHQIPKGNGSATGTNFDPAKVPDYAKAVTPHKTAQRVIGKILTSASMFTRGELRRAGRKKPKAAD